MPKQGKTSTQEEEHRCTVEECPEGQGNYYVSAVDGPSYYLMSGPYRTHAEALKMVDSALRIADKHDGRAWFMAWGTCRTQEAKPGVLQKHGLLPAEVA